MKKNELTLSEKEIILETDESINNDSSEESNENKELK